MGIMTDVKYMRKALSVANALKSKSETQINNELYDLRIKLGISEEDWIVLEASIATLTQRKILESIGLKNDSELGVSNV
jgi:hypothetical protein